MNDDQDTRAGEPKTADNDSRESILEALLRLAGPNDPIPDELRRRVYASARAELRRENKAPVVLWWALPAALAAAMLVVFGLNNSREVEPARTVGSVVIANNVAEAPGDEIRVGDVIDTEPDAGLSILLNNGISLRVDEDTVLEVESVKTFSLVAGRIYVDTGDRVYPRRNVTIQTASGSATDVGTKFSVEYERASMSVAVRDGRVDLSDSRATYIAEKGRKVILRPGEVAMFEDVPVTGSTWDWAVDLAPEFELEDSSLLEFLKWAANETGMELVFESEAVMTEAMSARLHGSIEGLIPLEAINAVLATTPFKHAIDGDRLLITKHE